MVRAKAAGSIETTYVSRGAFIFVFVERMIGEDPTIFMMCVETERGVALAAGEYLVKSHCREFLERSTDECEESQTLNIKCSRIDRLFI